MSNNEKVTPKRQRMKRQKRISKDVMGVNDLPVKKQRKKRGKLAKERVHIYISDESLQRIDTKAGELGLDRSPCIQMLINFALNNLKTDNLKSFSKG